MLKFHLEADKCLFEANIYSSFQVVAFPFKRGVVNLNNLDLDSTWPHIDILISRVLVFNNMPIRCAFLDPNAQTVHCLRQVFSLANVAGTRLNFASSRALVTLCLELLDHAWSNLLSLNYLALSLAVRTCLYIVGVICTAATTVRTDDLAIVLQVEVCTGVELF